MYLQSSLPTESQSLNCAFDESFLGKENTEEAYTATLYAVLKDHACKDAIELTIAGYKKSVKKAADLQGFSIENVETVEGSDFSVKPVQIVLNNNLDVMVKQEIKDGLQKMKFLNFDYKLIEDEESKCSYYLQNRLKLLFLALA